MVGSGDGGIASSRSRSYICRFVIETFRVHLELTGGLELYNYREMYNVFFKMLLVCNNMTTWPVIAAGS